MGREVRRVPIGWRHPRNTETGHYVPLLSGYREVAAEFLTKANYGGLQAAIDYFGQAPEKKHYMPEWPTELCTHYMMYETCTEGTPISPAFATPEALARWLTDNHASAFGRVSATYEGWLRVARGGYAPSAVLGNNMMTSGVDGVEQEHINVETTRGT